MKYEPKHLLSISQYRSLLNVLLIAAAVCVLGGCVTSMAPGSLTSIEPTSTTPRVGNVYLIRGWGGMFSWGIDELSRELESHGITTHVFQHDQRDQLCQTLIEKYRGVNNPEPLCMVAHSAGSDDALYISKRLEDAGVKVDLLITLDNVDATIVPANVRLCYNYWLPGTFGDSNFLRGLPMEKEPGSNGKLVNINVAQEGKDLCEPDPSHVSLDKDKKLRPHIVEHVLAACPERTTWAAAHRIEDRATLSSGPNLR